MLKVQKTEDDAKALRAIAYRCHKRFRPAESSAMFHWNRCLADAIPEAPISTGRGQLNRSNA